MTRRPITKAHEVLALNAVLLEGLTLYLRTNRRQTGITRTTPMVNFNELPKPENFGTPPDRSKNSVKTENAHPSGGGEQTPTSAPFGGFGRHGGAK